jgi:chemotaxis protein methyltransferase CheR
MENSQFHPIMDLDTESFNRLSAFITGQYGIKLPLSKKSMVESRLNKKLRELKMPSYKDFLDFVFTANGSEHLVDVVDLMTTNKTDFFREPHHFTFLKQQALPEFQKAGRNNLRVWSAGCSTGEEPYTILMVLEEYKKLSPEFAYSILSSDISTRALKKAYNGIYPLQIMSTISMDLKRSYFLRGKVNPDLARVKAEYRQKIMFKSVNLMDDNLQAPKDLDIIFCRNVLIYFDKPTQERLLRKFCSHLRSNGLIFLGHSESIMGMDLPLTQVGMTTYQLQR